MRSADVASLLRIPLLLIVVCAIVMHYSPIAVILLLILLFVSDATDGYLASAGEHTFLDFISYLLEEGHLISKKKRKSGHAPRYAAYLDLAVDRLIEYALWLTFVLLQVLPWIVFAIILVRNMLADVLLLRKGKVYSRLHTAFGRVASSHLSRGAYAILKAVNFGYLSLVVVANWPVSIAYLLTIIVVLFSLARGAAEVYEALV